MAMSALLRFAWVTVRVFSLAAVVSATLTGEPLTEVSISQWFRGIRWLKEWLRTPGVYVAVTPSSVTSYSERTGAVALEASNTARVSLTQEVAARARTPASRVNIFFIGLTC